MLICFNIIINNIIVRIDIINKIIHMVINNSIISIESIGINIISIIKYYYYYY